jgi:hypothetical protein
MTSAHKRFYSRLSFRNPAHKKVNLHGEWVIS